MQSRPSNSLRNMVPLHFRGVPRRSRLLAVAFFCACLIFLLPRTDLGVASTLGFFFFGPDFSGGYGSKASGVDILQFIDPLIGTTNGGHVFPGATLPYGMAKAVADTRSPGENAAGFVSDDAPIIGFSHLHDSGTGGAASLGNFPLFVHPGCPADDFAKCDYSVNTRGTDRVQGSAFASPGYFSVNMTNSVRAEMTTTEHTALYRFTFPGTETVNVTVSEDVAAEVPYSPLLLLDLVDLSNSRSAGRIQVYPESGRIVGDGAFAPSFGQGRYTAYFCADFRGAAIRNSGTFSTNVAKTEPKVLDSASGVPLGYGSTGAWLHFERPANDSLLARVGLSFISSEQACQNAEREVPDFSFGAVEDRARDIWREKLSVIEVDATGVSEELQTTFWSGLYRSLLSPQNYTGENQLWNSTEPYFDSFYCIWDSFRAQHPLLTIIDPEAQTQMVRALIDIYRHEEKLPDCRMSFSKGFTQGGSNADIVIADAFVKNLTENIDWKTAYEAVVSDAEEEPQQWGIHGRGNLESWHKLGWIPYDDHDTIGSGPMSRTISRGVEYAYDDFCIALLADGLGRPEDAAKYYRRGGNWVNYWNPDQRDVYRDEAGEVVQTSFAGFMQPRLLNGSFRYHNTRTCSPIYNTHACYFDTGYDTYEGSPWLYSFFVPQNMASLIKLMGGPKRFVERLTFFHTSGLSYMGNEQGFLPTYQFHHAGRPGLSSFWLHSYIPSLFNATVNGIPGNDDCAMGAFSAFAMMGFFPVAGQDVYLLTPPFFPEVRIRAKQEGKWAVIRIKNFDPAANAAGGRAGAIYIQSARLDGRRYSRNWISHDFFVTGGVLEFVVGERESSWGTRPDEVPPSYPTWEDKEEETNGRKEAEDAVPTLDRDIFDGGRGRGGDEGDDLRH
ncbi:glycosyl hydrolase family 92-domain-containing protein [Echria macrotheca]|uniref:Glycosyl hydrolase family 92-domain-containing protein n=1 Tax=Echria macrotheca TaxID=438768 RepID=A0AAJ0BK26_9PEZI|nr:glycosyl hydrolase family 92-domain-containing protein [Echria macrotheca]